MKTADWRANVQSWQHAAKLGRELKLPMSK